MMRRFTLALILILAVIGTANADTRAGSRKATPYTMRTTEGVDITSVVPMNVATDSTYVYTESAYVADSEAQSIGVTISSTGTVAATFIVQYSIGSGATGAPAENWLDLSSSSTSITESYDDAVALNLPVCYKIRLRFSPDDDVDYNVTHCVLGRY